MMLLLAAIFLCLPSLGVQITHVEVNYLKFMGNIPVFKLLHTLQHCATMDSPLVKLALEMTTL